MSLKARGDRTSRQSGQMSRGLAFGLSFLVTLLASAVWARGQGQLPPAKNAGGAAPKAGGTGAPAGQPSAPAAPKAAPQPAPQGAITSDDDPRVKAAVAKAAVFLKKSAMANQSDFGQFSLCVHALAKIHEKYPDLVAADDPALKRGVEALRTYCQGGFKPPSQGGKDNYESGVGAMALAAADGQAYKEEIGHIAQYILNKQRENGSWHYDGKAGSSGDTSQTQYSILGMWEAVASAGVAIPKSAWDRVAGWLIKTQLADGGFAYNPPEAGPGQVQTGHSTHTMVVATLGSLYICRDHLPGGKRKTSRGVLQQVQEEEDKAESSYRAATTPDQINAAIDRAYAWLEKNYTLTKATGESDPGGGMWQYYYIYAFERFATLSGQKVIAGHDWYDEGAKYLIGKQGNDGSFTGGIDPIVDTGFSVLFLVRSTHISQRIHQRRLGRGTLISGRGLPTNLAELEQVGGGLKAKAVPGNIGKLMATVEGGQPEEIEAAARSAVQKVYEKKWSAGGEEGDKLRKQYQKGLATKNSAVILLTLKQLALTGDYRVVPILIDGMYYEDDAEVQLAAHKSLCQISRKFNGFGAIYPEEASLEEWKAEIERWKQWYRAVRPEASFEDDIDLIVK